MKVCLTNGEKAFHADDFHIRKNEVKTCSEEFYETYKHVLTPVESDIDEYSE